MKVPMEKEFNDLSVHDQALIFLKSSDSNRLKVLETSHKPGQLLAKIPATEVWATVKRLTPQDALLLIRYSTPEQLQVMGDIEWWRKDRIDVESMYEWLEYILACGINKVMQWLRECDWDQILWFFKENIVVYKKEEKDEDPAAMLNWPREENPITYDGVFFFQVIEEKYDQVIRRILEIAAKNDMLFFHKICEAVLWEIPSQREEEAYETRSRRLAEHGFPSFDEAISVYSPLNKKKFKMANKRDESPSVEFAPRYPLVPLGDQVLFLNRVLPELGVSEEERFLVEVAGIANKVLVADAKDIDDENLRSSLIKTMGYVNIGLEILADNNISEAVKLLKDYWLITIFQVGLSEVLKLSQDAKRVFEKSWMNGKEEYLSLLEPHLRLLVINLISKRPKHYTGSDELAVGSIKDFMSLVQLQKSREEVLESEFIGKVVEDIFLGAVGKIFEMIDYPQDLRFTGIFLTALINFCEEGKAVFKPVNRDILWNFISNKKIDENIGFFKKEIFSKIGTLTAEENRYLNDFVDASRLRFSDEFKDVVKLPESHFIHSVWVN